MGGTDRHRSSPSAAVAREELGQDELQGFVDGHGVVLAQVVSTGGAGVDVSLEGPLEAFPADVMLALCGDWLIDHFLAAYTQEHLLHFVQELRSKS